MLKGIPNVLTPETLKVLSEMGHDDELVIADANFPSHSVGKKVIRLDGIKGPELLKAVLQVIPLDTYSDTNFILMDVSANDIKPSIWNTYVNIAEQIDGNLRLSKLERFDFYERARNAYVVLATSEETQYANIIIKKGVIR